jgi:hypothetical protein
LKLVGFRGEKPKSTELAEKDQDEGMEESERLQGNSNETL